MTVERNRTDNGVIGRRTWLLMLLDAAERTGLTPLPEKQIHQLAFLANCLVPVYQMEVTEGQLLKHPRGPFYPELQWDLDRLAIQGLLEISSMRYVSNSIDWRFQANYALSDRGIDGVRMVLQTPRARRNYDYLVEAASAYASMKQQTRVTAAFQDATYRAVLDRSLIDLADVNRNYSVHTADAFQQFVPEGIRLDAKDKLHLYFRYLEGMVEKVAA